ncbi:MAG: hypothetical protein AB7S38_36075 [Vulcanimicrobiota bacterium]
MKNLRWLLLSLCAIATLAAIPRSDHPTFVSRWQSQDTLEFNLAESTFFDSAPRARVVDFLTATYPTLKFHPWDDGFTASGPRWALERSGSEICKLEPRSIPKPSRSWSVDGISLGMSRDEVIASLGQPAHAATYEVAELLEYPRLTIEVNRPLGVVVVSGRSLEQEGRVLATVGEPWRPPSGDLRFDRSGASAWLCSPEGTVVLELSEDTVERILLHIDLGLECVGKPSRGDDE